MQLGTPKNGHDLTFKIFFFFLLLKLTPVQHRRGEGNRTHVRASSSWMGCTNQRRIVVNLYKFQASCNGVCYDIKKGLGSLLRVYQIYGIPKTYQSTKKKHKKHLITYCFQDLRFISPLIKYNKIASISPNIRLDLVYGSNRHHSEWTCIGFDKSQNNNEMT